LSMWPNPFPMLTPCIDCASWPWCSWNEGYNSKEKAFPLLETWKHKNRLAIAHQYWTVKAWKKVVWSNETKHQQIWVRWKEMGMEKGWRGLNW
jgi:hypothetical protein